MTVSLKLNETKRRMVYVSLKRTETDTVYIQHCLYDRCALASRIQVKVPTTLLRIRTSSNRSRKGTHTPTPEEKEPEDTKFLNASSQARILPRNRNAKECEGQARHQATAKRHKSMTGGSSTSAYYII